MALLQTKTTAKTTGSVSSTSAWTSNTTSGSLVVVGIGTDQGATGVVTSVTDSQGNTYQKVGTIVSGGGAISTVDLWYSANIVGGTTPTITANFNAAAITGIIAREYSGFDMAKPYNASSFAKSASAGTALSSAASPPTSNPQELVIGFASTGDSGNTYAAGGGFANAVTLKVGTTIDLGMEDLTTTVPGAQTATFTITNVSDWACAVATFRTPTSTPGNEGAYLRVGNGMSRSEVAN